ncbi:MAG: hypothetical protein ABI837_01680 [Acidobacteriota bacterium]
MKILTFTVLLLVASSSILAQPVSPATDVDRLIARELAASKAFNTLAELTDGIGARPSGSPNAAAAVLWALNRFHSWGHRGQAGKGVRATLGARGVETATLVSHHNQRIVLTALGMSVATPLEGITAEVIAVHSFDELKSLGAARIRGKIVVYDVPIDMPLVLAHHAFDAYRLAQPFRGGGPSRAAEFGAVAVVIRALGTASLRTPHTGSLEYDQKQPRIPAAAMTAEDSGLVQRLLAKGDRVRMRLVLTPRTLPDVLSANVIAEIKGSEHPEEIVLIGAHLELPRHIAAIETDAGAPAPTGFNTTLKGEALSKLQASTTSLGRIGASKFETVARPGADTSFLVDAGVPGFGLVPEPLHYFDYHHTAADTLDKIDPQELAHNSAAVAALAWLLSETGLPR